MMTSRERVRKVLNHELPDYVPNGLGGCETEGLHVITYRRLQRVLGLPDTPPRLDTFMSNAVFEQDVIQKMEGDIILLASPNMCSAPLRGKDVMNHWKSQRLWNQEFCVSKKEEFVLNEDGSVVWKTAGNTICPKGSFFFDGAEPSDLLADFAIPDPKDFHPKDQLDDTMLRNLEQAAKELYEGTDLSICLGESITDLQIQPGGMVGCMVLMLEEPDVMGEFLEKSVEAGLKQIEQLNQAVGKYVDILSIAHDFGDNRGVTIGAPLWRKIYRPFYQKLFEGWKKRTNMHINLHSCGSIAEILPDLEACGVEIVNPVQISAAGMSPQELKSRFGNRLIFWGGGYDTQLYTRTDSYETVYQKVRDTIRIMKEGGGYFFSGVHNLPAEVSETHLKAMLDAWKDERAY